MSSSYVMKLLCERSQNVNIGGLLVWLLALSVAFTACDDEGNLVVDHSLTQDLTTPAHLLPTCEEFESRGRGPGGYPICEPSEVDLRCRFVDSGGTDQFGTQACSCRAVCYCRSGAYWRETVQTIAELPISNSVPPMWDCRKYDCAFADPDRCVFRPGVAPEHF